MNELREQAMKHILRIEKLREQHAEFFQGLADTLRTGGREE